MAKSFGRYKVAEEIGRGAMGVVYRAVDPAIGRVVAIKAINHAYLESVGVKDDEYAERFQREAQVAGALDHVHIVKIFDLGPDYLVMEYVEGETLAARLRARGRLERADILRIVRDTGAALDYAHERGIVHRDIKPANLMVQRDGSVKVMDFGLARIESSTLTAAGEVLGSASYMAPEVILGQPADGRSDTFALAVVAYEMFTGQRPFGGASVSAIIHNVVRQQPRSARELNAALPGGYDAIFGRAFAKDPAARFASASAFAEALEREAWPHALVAQVGSREPVLAAPAPSDDPGAGTVLSVNADEIAGLPSAGEGDAGSTTVMVASSEEVEVHEDRDEESKATVVLNAAEMEARLQQLAADREAAIDTARTPLPGAEPPQPAAAADTSTDRTVRLTTQTADETVEARAVRPPAPPVAEEKTAATIIMKADVPRVVAPTVPSEPEPAPTPEAEEQPAVEATLVMKFDQFAAVIEKRPAQPPVVPAPIPPTLQSADASAATIVMKSPLASPRVPPPPAPAAATPADEEGPGATIVMKPKAPPIAPPPAAPPPPASAKPAPAPPPAAPQPAASLEPPAKRSGGKGLVIGLALAIPIVFGLTVAGVWFWIRWQNQRAQAPAPEPTAVAAEATPTPAPPAATPEATAPSPEPTPEETPTPEASTTPPPANDEATLLVRSQPVGASVFVGGKKRGSTPLKLRLPAGATSVRVEKEGYKPWKNDARLKSGEARTLDARLEPLAAPAPTATPPPAKPALREGDLVPVSDEVTLPKKTKNVSPNVPAIARKKHMAGSVLVEFIVNVDGRVADAKVIESAGEVLDGAALEAIRQWRYQPATSHGVKVRVAQRARFTFQ